MASSKLTAMQDEVLHAFFARERGFFLTGGAALAGFYLHHRTTDDLDLFAVDADAFERGRHVLADLAAELGAQHEVRQEAPGFRRTVLRRGDDAVVVDLVFDRAPQIVREKPTFDGIRVDPPEEIVANKLTALVGRMEERDLVDLMCLDRAGYAVEPALADALTKDGGCTPATLAWLLSEMSIPDGVKLPAGVTPGELREFVATLQVRLRRFAFPTAPSAS